MSKHGNVSTSLARRASSPSLSVGRRGERGRDLFVLTHTLLGLRIDVFATSKYCVLY